MTAKNLPCQGWTSAELLIVPSFGRLRQGNLHLGRELRRQTGLRCLQEHCWLDLGQSEAEVGQPLGTFPSDLLRTRQSVDVRGIAVSCLFYFVMLIISNRFCTIFS